MFTLDAPPKAVHQHLYTNLSDEWSEWWRLRRWSNDDDDDEGNISSLNNPWWSELSAVIEAKEFVK